MLRRIWLSTSDAAVTVVIRFGAATYIRWMLTADRPLAALKMSRILLNDEQYEPLPVKAQQVVRGFQEEICKLIPGAERCSTCGLVVVAGERTDTCKWHTDPTSVYINMAHDAERARHYAYKLSRTA